MSSKKLVARHGFVVIFLMLLFTNFMGFRYFTGLTQGIIGLILYPSLAFIFFTKKSYLKGCEMFGYVKWTLLGCFISVIPSVIIFGQSIYQAFAGITIVLFPILLYFLLHKWNIEEKLIFRFLIIFTAVFAFFEIIQQITYPVFWFNGRPPDEHTGLLEERMGFLRFYLFGINYCVLAILIYYGKTLRKSGSLKKNLLCILVGALAIYFFLARKNIYAVLSCFVVGAFFSRKSGTLWTKVFILFLIVGIVLFLSESMSELNTQTSEEMGDQGEDFIRFVAADYFMFQFNHTPLYYLFGSGIPGGINSLHKELFYLSDTMHLFQDDCGIIGFFSRFGIFGVSIQLYSLFKIFSNYKYLNVEYILFALLELELCFFDYWGNNTRNMAAWILFIYLVDKNIKHNKYQIASRRRERRIVKKQTDC